ncbi:MAG TPA: beta-ketoacyl synthase N-terminal-like domain-containing protein [Thermoanaerobaculia bacterium]|nr:beta-ketoacyl synthase N-terminal-like domain-containing protein [Thermoanaerobaculia bacterium]
MPLAEPLYVSAYGGLTPLGHDRETLWQRVVRGERGYVLNGGRPAGRIAEEELDDRLPARKYRRLPRYSKLVLAAAAAAIADLGGEKVWAGFDLSRVGVFLGTGRGPLEAVESLSDDLVAGQARQVNATHFQETVYNAPLGHLSIHYGITGPCVAISSGTASGLLALEMAVAALAAGRIDLALVGGVDTFTSGYQDGMGDAGVLAGSRGRRPDMAPFAADRNGIVIGEGGLFVVLERGSVLERRAGSSGGRLARLSGIASASDGFSFYGNEPGGAGFAHAIRGCLAAAGIAPSEVDFIFASAGGERQLDRAEWEGIGQVWGGRPAAPVTALKGLTGDMGAASALFALAVGCEVFQRDLIPGLVQEGDLDPACDLDVPRAARPVRVERALVNEAAWGGVNASVLLERPGNTS